MGSKGKRNERLGQVLRRHRQERGLTLKELATRAGISPSLVTYVESGRVGISLDKFIAILAVLDLSADQVLKEAGYLEGARGAPKTASLRQSLREQYKLSPASLGIAETFLEFLQKRDKSANRRVKK